MILRKVFSGPEPQLLPEHHPSTVIRNWGDNRGYRIADAQSGTFVSGATGSGKTSGPAKHLALGFLAHNFGGLVCCGKKEECSQWEQWAKLTGRSKDLVIFRPDQPWSFNFLDWESKRSGAGGGFTINIVNLLDEIAAAVSSGTSGEGGGDNKFWEDSGHHLNCNAVDLPNLAGIPITLTLLRAIVNSAPQSPQQAIDPAWAKQSICAALLAEADEKTRTVDIHRRADFEECRNYWMQEFPALSDKTRSIIVLQFSMLVRPLVTSPLLPLFGSAQTNVTPEDCFDGKIIIIDVPVQEYRLAGRIANLAWKYCFQIAVMRRTPPRDKGTYLRPVFLWADEAQNFVTRFDAEYQAVARSAGGCTVYLTQNRESLRRVLGSDDSVDSLLGNLQSKWFCQNGSTVTNGWASNLLGERWVEITNRSGGAGGYGIGNADGRVTATAGYSTVSQKRNYVEPVRFATLRRGGEHNNFLVDCLIYNGGEQYPSPDGSEEVPFKFITFDQRS